MPVFKNTIQFMSLPALHLKIDIISFDLCVDIGGAGSSRREGECIEFEFQEFLQGPFLWNYEARIIDRGSTSNLDQL